MTVALDAPIRVGDVVVAAIAERRLQSGALWVHAEKRPVAVLLRRNGETLAFEPDGRPIGLDAFERRYPGRRAEFERVAETDRTS